MIMIGANEAQWLGPGDRDTKHYQAHYEKVLGAAAQGAPRCDCLVVSPTDQAEAKDGGYPSRPVMPLLVEAQRKAAHAAGLRVLLDVRLDGRQGLRREVVHEGPRRHRLPASVAQGREQARRRACTTP